ncbi:hypothetical protein [Bacillus pumilus]
MEKEDQPNLEMKKGKINNASLSGGGEEGRTESFVREDIITLVRI